MRSAPMLHRFSLGGLANRSFDVVAIWIYEERGVIAASALAGCSVISPSMSEARFVKGNDSFSRWGREGQMEGASSGAMLLSPEFGSGYPHPDKWKLRCSTDDHSLISVSFGNSQPQGA